MSYCVGRLKSIINHKEQQMRYTIEEKLAHLQRAKTFVNEGKGTYTAYAKANGVPRTTFHQWIHVFGPNKPAQQGQTSKSPLVNLGKPLPPVTGEQKFVIDYYGSRIEVNSEDTLVELLKGIKRASTT